MNRLVIRHGLCESNPGGFLAIDAPDVKLTERGRQQAVQLGSTLAEEYGIDSRVVPTTSELYRTQETAHLAGFSNISVDDLLNEATKGLDPSQIRSIIQTKRLPSTVISAAEAILAKPPRSKIWITHAFVIAGLCEALGSYQNDRFIPRFCEIRELSI